MHPLLEKQEQLHGEATEVLESVLLPILKGFGEVVVGGSYLYKLLNFRDIDIDIIHLNSSKRLYAELCARLLEHDEVSELNTCDRVHFPHKVQGDRPVGYWVSPKIQYKGNEWKCDVWLLSREQYSGNTIAFKDALLNLNEEKRITILKIKEALIKEKVYGVGKEFRSVDVYNAVLEDDVQSVDELRALRSRKM